MLTRRLRKAHEEVSNLADFLAKRDWKETSELVSIFEKANNEIKQIVEKAINDALEKTERYSIEAETWAKNDMKDFLGFSIELSENDQREALAELARIKKTIKILEKMIKEQEL